MDERSDAPVEAPRSRLWTLAWVVLVTALLMTVAVLAASFGASLGYRPDVAVSTWTPLPRPSSLVTLTPTSETPFATPTRRIPPTRIPPTPAPSPEASGTPRIHIVQSGETLLGIAQQHRVDYNELLAINNIDNPDRIAAGQTLVLPASLPTPAAGSVEHVVQEGETLFGIALNYGVPMEAIMQANGLANPDSIMLGQRLTIPPPAAPPAR